MARQKVKLRSSMIFRSVIWSLLTNVSSPYCGAIFKGQRSNWPLEMKPEPRRTGFYTALVRRPENCWIWRTEGRSQWPCGLRRRPLAARLLRLWVRIPPGAWIFVCCECCVLSGRGLCDGLIFRSEESYRMWRVVVCDQETSQARRLKPTRGL